MWIALAVVALALVAGGYFAATEVQRRRDASSALARVVDTKPAEQQAEQQAHTEAEHDASVVLRSSDDELRREVEELAARGRSGK